METAYYSKRITFQFVLLFVVFFGAHDAFGSLVIVDDDDANTTVSFNLYWYGDNHCRFQWSLNGSSWSGPGGNAYNALISPTILDFRYEYDVNEDGTMIGYKYLQDINGFTINDLDHDGNYDDITYSWIITSGESIYGPKYPWVHVEVTGQSGIRDRISAVPIPAAAWLFGSAIVGITIMRKHKRLHLHQFHGYN